MAAVIFHIPQMDCPTEEKMIKNHLDSLPGILELDFNLIQQELKVTYQDVEIAAIQKALTSIGMKAWYAPSIVDTEERYNNVTGGVQNECKAISRRVQERSS